MNKLAMHYFYKEIEKDAGVPPLAPVVGAVKKKGMTMGKAMMYSIPATGLVAGGYGIGKLPGDLPVNRIPE